ncbi:MAG: CRTAC1 family protein [Planctomycetes bacterium]|nr:CRTAC1 family protein [Planctomycetota bacterium]
MRGPTTLLFALLLCASSGCGEPGPPDTPDGARGAPAAAPGTRPADAPAPRAPAAHPAGDAPLPATELVDEARERGLDYQNRSGSAAKRVILEANGAGVAVLDLESDGDLDLVFAQGASAIPPRDAGAPELFENAGGGRFERRALEAPAAWWTGLAAGDLDGDGDDDLVVAGFGALEVFLQEDGRLVRRAGAIPPEALGLDRDGVRVASWFTSLALFDADRDGVLDLYAGRYLDLDLEHPPLGALGTGPLAIPCRWKGHEVFCGPAGLVPQPDLVFRGRGDGTFEDVSARWLTGHVAGYTLGVLAFDADGDLDTDLFVANDTSPDLLLVNDGRGQLTDVARAAGVALSSEGRMQAGMGAAAGDVDRDGLQDFAVTNFSDEPTELFLGAPQGFRRATNAFGLLGESRSLLSWGVHLVDFDGDGWLELLTMNGHVYPQADHEHTGTSYGQPATLWRLGPERKAVRVAPRAAASVLREARGARGSAIGDLDLDGAPDVVLVRIDAPAALGMNRTPGAAARLAVRLLGPVTPSERAPRTPRDGRGATAIVVVGRGAQEHALLAETQTAAGFQSSSTPWLHFGLGRAQRYERLIVRWPSGRVDEFQGGAANARIVVREGAGVVAREAWR